MKKITLDFDGYWREANKDSIPRQSGIYCVYTCTYNATEHTVSIKKMLYIGESTNVHDRIAAHDRLDDWKKNRIGLRRRLHLKRKKQAND